MKKEVFLSKQGETVVEKYLYESGIYITMGMEREGLAELQKAVNLLEPIEAEIITRKYLSRESDYVRHQTIYKDLGISWGTYNKTRLRALTKLGTELGIISMVMEDRL
ncbi:hypothetical protein [Paenibacillus sp. NPDC057934]|uniref:hypothetical protein n=1 Tax=Paenibacillus sp. NPDC057934 TaxID=3346282 RepID=UPI0036DF16F0